MLYALADGLTHHSRSLAHEEVSVYEVAFIAEELLAASRMLELIAEKIEQGTWI